MTQLHAPYPDRADFPCASDPTPAVRCDDLDDYCPDNIVPDFLPWLPARRVGPRGWTAATQRAFIAELMRHASVRRASVAVGKSARSAYQLRDKPGAEHFAVAWDAAVVTGKSAVMGAVMPRLLNGEAVPVFRRGRQVGVRVEHDDRLAIAVLGAHRWLGGAAPGADSDIELQRYRLERWEVALRRRELDLIDAETGTRARSLVDAEEHALAMRAFAAEDRVDRLRMARAAERARRASIRAQTRARLQARAAGPRVRGL